MLRPFNLNASRKCRIEIPKNAAKLFLDKNFTHDPCCLDQFKYHGENARITGQHWLSERYYHTQDFLLMAAEVLLDAAT